MLAIDRSDRANTLTSRLAVLAANDPRIHVVDGATARSAIPLAVSRREPLYFVDNLRLAARTAMRFPTATYVLDVGDDVGSLLRTQGRGLPTAAAATLAQAFACKRAHGIICRGLGQAGSLRTLGCSRVSVIPDLPTVASAQSPKPHNFCLGFIGSTHLHGRTPPAGWEMARILTLLHPRTRAVMIVTGTGVDWLRNQAKDLGVFDRITFIPGLPPEQIPVAFREVDVAVSSQTFNLAGEVRTTGKLVDYLAMGKVVIATRVGTASAILPPSWTVASLPDMYSDAYVRALGHAVEKLLSQPVKEWIEMQHFAKALATRLFDVEGCRAQWINTLSNWGVLT